jgi:hypothetical protein
VDDAPPSRVELSFERRAKKRVCGRFLRLSFFFIFVFYDAVRSAGFDLGVKFNLVFEARALSLTFFGFM